MGGECPSSLPGATPVLVTEAEMMVFFSHADLFRSGSNIDEDHRELIFPELTGFIWFDDVYCTGDEASIVDCDREPINEHDCSHDEDAACVCYNFLGDVG